jgi:hypothetical protein
VQLAVAGGARAVRGGKGRQRTLAAGRRRPATTVVAAAQRLRGWHAPDTARGDDERARARWCVLAASNACLPPPHMNIEVSRREELAARTGHMATWPCSVPVTGVMLRSATADPAQGSPAWRLLGSGGTGRCWSAAWVRMRCGRACLQQRDTGGCDMRIENVWCLCARVCAHL